MLTNYDILLINSTEKLNVLHNTTKDTLKTQNKLEKNKSYDLHHIFLCDSIRLSFIVL